MFLDEYLYQLLIKKPHNFLPVTECHFTPQLTTPSTCEKSCGDSFRNKEKQQQVEEKTEKSSVSSTEIQEFN